MKRLFLAVLILIMAASSPAVSLAQSGGDPVYADPAMNSAIAEARTYLDPFLAAVRDAGQRSDAFMLKVALDTKDGGREHIWLDSLRYEGDALKGALANAPNGLPGLRQGSVITVDRARISDWSILSREGMFGNFTTRVMLPRLEAGQRAQVEAMLAPQPVPAGWRARR
jgi:uncharacterized protein YegJ (DUF2314 family)